MPSRSRSVGDFGICFLFVLSVAAHAEEMALAIGGRLGLGILLVVLGMATHAEDVSFAFGGLLALRLFLGHDAVLSAVEAACGVSTLAEGRYGVYDLFLSV